MGYYTREIIFKSQVPAIEEVINKIALIIILTFQQQHNPWHRIRLCHNQDSIHQI